MYESNKPAEQIQCCTVSTIRLKTWHWNKNQTAYSSSVLLLLGRSHVKKTWKQIEKKSSLLISPAEAAMRAETWTDAVENVETIGIGHNSHVTQRRAALPSIYADFIVHSKQPSELVVKTTVSGEELSLMHDDE